MAMANKIALVSAAVLTVVSVVMVSLFFTASVSAGAVSDVQGLSGVTLAKRSVLCDNTDRGVIKRQHFAPKCPRGWRLASTGPVMCFRNSGARSTFVNGCPAGWRSYVVNLGLKCVIAQRTWWCNGSDTTATTTSTVAPTTSTTVRPSSTTVRPTITTTTTVVSTTTSVAPTTVAPATTVAPTTTTLPPSASFDARGWEAEILRLTNLERQNAGLGTMASCARLATAALGHTNRMLAGQFFAHDDPVTGSAIVDRIRNTGYLEGAGAWRVGENIAMGHESAAATMVGWMNSPGHRANILNSVFTHLGIGVSIGVWEAWRSTYSNWDAATMATQNFGTGGTC